MRALFLALVATLMVTTATPEAHAQRRQPGVSYRAWREAKTLFNQGHLAYRQGDYEEAIVKWEKSQELSKETIIFESIANAYERLGNSTLALENLRKWRKEAPRREHRALDQRLIRLEERVAEDEEAARKQAEKKERLEKEEEQLRQQKAMAERTTQLEEERKQRAAEDKSQIIGFSLAGVGGAAVIAGVVMDIVAAEQRPDTTEGCVAQSGKTLCSNTLQADIEASNTLAIAGDVTWIAGSAIAVTGIVLLFVLRPGDALEDDLPKSDDASDDAETDDDNINDALVAPYATPHGGGVLVFGTF